MPVWTHDQIVNAAQSVGFSASGAQTIAAIALAESRGDTGAISPLNSNGTRDYGIVQINSVHFSEGAISQAQALQPIASLAYALRLSDNGTNFAPWSTFTSGAYRPFLSSVSSSSATIADTTPGGSTVQSVTTFLNESGHSVLLFLVAIILLVVGLYFLAK
jgi:Lysozyme like domain